MSEIYWPSFFFLLFGGLSCAFAVAVLLSSNIVRMAFYLVMSLGSAAGLFFLAGQDFVGAMQLLIYVGGTLVLLIFGVMLTSQERFIHMKPKADDLVWGLFAGGGLLGLLVWAAISVPEWRGLELEEVQQVAQQHTAAQLGLGLLGARVDNPSAPGYLLHFEIVSVHLLVVLVGAAYLARAKRRRSNLPEASE